MTLETQRDTALAMGSVLNIVRYCSLYVLCAAGAYLFFQAAQGNPIIWPATGVFLAALLVSSRRQWWGLVPASLACDLAVRMQLGDLTASEAVVLPFLAGGQAIAAALLIQRFHEEPLRFERLQDVMALLLWGGLLPAAILGVPASMIAGNALNSFTYSGWAWWVTGNCLQIMTVTPVVLLLSRDSQSHIRQAKPVFWVEVTALLVSLVATTVLVFSYDASPGAALPPYSFLPFAFLTWSALRLGPRATALACLTFSLVALWFDTGFIGADAGDVQGNIGALGAFLLIATVSALSSASVIAESRNDTERLAENERKLREVMTLAPIGIYIADKEKYAYTNPAGAKIIGLSSPDEIVGMSVMSFYPPEGKAAAQQRIDSLVDEGSGSRPRIVNTVVDAAGNRRIVEAMATAIRWDGRPSFLVMVNDISGRKQAEDAMMRAQKMEAVGQLSGGIAHDFNNILGIIIGNLELVQDMAADRPEIAERIELALKSVNRGASITHKLLSFSREKTQATTLTSLSAIIDAMQELISRSLTAAVTVENRLADDLWMVDLDPGEFQDALVNLALNARDAMPDGGTLVIAAENTRLDAEYVKLNPLAREGEFVMISVTDTGIGMDQDVADRIFEPFFSTKGEGKGSGLGLSMVYGFVQRSGGHIKVETRPGKGTTFRIYLPRATRTHTPVSTRAQTPVAQLRGTETILIVDDEAEVTDIASHNLGFLGYTVLTASNGSEALEILKTNPYIDLLFSDVVMPGGQDGYQLAVEAHKMFPELKILLTSGFTQRREHATNGEEAFISKLANGLLNKPYNRRQLARAIRQTLEAGR